MFGWKIFPAVHILAILTLDNSQVTDIETCLLPPQAIMVGQEGKDERFMLSMYLIRDVPYHNLIVRYTHSLFKINLSWKCESSLLFAHNTASSAPISTFNVWIIITQTFCLLVAV